MKPYVSVVIPCRNEVRFLTRCLDSVLASDYPSDRMEVIVADGMSVDGTRRLLDARGAADSRLRWIDNPEGITPVALNRAIAASKGEILLRFDGHAAMPPDYIRRCVELLGSAGAENAGGSIRALPQSDGPFSGPILCALRNQFGVGNSSFRTHLGEKGARRTDTVFGGCWRRDLFSRLGGFNPRLARGQDMEFNLRLKRHGGQVVLDPEIICDYYARTDLASFLRHSFTNGIWAILPFGRSDIVPVRARHLVPLGLVLALGLSPWFPFPWSLGIAGVYAAATIAASARIAIAERKTSYLALMPVVFVILHVAYGLGSVCGCAQLVLEKFARARGDSS